MLRSVFQGQAIITKLLIYSMLRSLRGLGIKLKFEFGAVWAPSAILNLTGSRL